MTTSPAMSLTEATAALTAEGQMFEMGETTIRGVSTRTWKNAPESLRAVLERSRNHRDRDFIVYEDERITFAQHFDLAATFAHRLVELGVSKGDRVAIAMRNLPEWIVAFWGTVSIGAIAVPINAWWTGEELSYGLADSGSIVVVVDTERLGRIRPLLDELEGLNHVLVVSENRHESPDLGARHQRVSIRSFSELLEETTAATELPAAEIQPDDDATIFYTSGTTGRPKGAVGTHRNSCSNLMNLFFISTRSTLRFGAGNSTDGVSIQNAYLLSVPLFHATGCQAVLVVNTAAGGKLVMMHHFDPDRALELIEREKITTFGGVPTMVMQVLDSPDLATRDTSSVRSVSYGGAPAPPELVRRIRETFPIGQPGNGYGMTETTAATAMNTGPDYVERPDSVGTAVPVTDVAVVPEGFDGAEPDPLRPQGPDVTGELWIKGPQVVRGYWNRPTETAATFTAGWVRTGDIARLDEEGFIYIVDRAKDVIIRGGENIYSVEVEAALFEHPDIADCAVIGVPHEVLGEEVAAVIVLRPERRITAEELARHVKDRLAAYNVPKHFYFRDSPLPRNPAGKVLKRELRDSLGKTV
ncbi:MAG: AMP-binding protein [Actinomycetes bacterium]